jgi:autotransporter-associated beta strand protein
MSRIFHPAGFCLLLPFALCLAHASRLSAASLNYQTTTPVLGPNDVGNLAGAAQDRDNLGGDGATDGGTNDAFTYVAPDRSQQGQTFTTGPNPSGYWVKAVWLRHAGYSGNSVATYWQTANGKTLTVRVTNPAAVGSSSFALASELVISSGSEPGTPNALAPMSTGTNSLNGTGVWLRFAFTTSVKVLPNTQYGFDVTSNSSNFYFETAGIRNAAPGGNPYAGGSAYNGSTSGAADNTMNTLAGDRVFVVELVPYVAPSATPIVQAEPFPLGRVRLLDSRFKSNQDLDRTGYLSSITTDQLLYPFRANAGLSQPAGAASLGGWEGSTGFTAVRGHMAGHYLSAVSKMYAATGDASLPPKIQAAVTELKKCQDALATKTDAASRSLSGYLSAFPISFFETLETNPGSAQVPFYTIHKIMAGLVDAYRYAGITQALDMAIAMSDYHAGRMARLSASQIEAMFVASTGHTEWGGMNETLCDLYRLSKDRGDSNPERHLAFAEYFHRDWFLTPLAGNVDKLNTLANGSPLHANTHIPQVVGFADYASVLDATHPQHDRLYAAADNFWHMVTGKHWLALGGNSYAEHFRAPGVETETSDNDLKQSAETCNTYNMLKLTSELFQHNPAVDYADFYEHALYNHILAGLAPDTGMFTYFVPMISGHFKTYCLPVGSSWCCQGTGMENPSQYGQAIYFHKDNTLWVNLYLPSTLNWSELGLSLRLDSSLPQSGTAQLTLTCSQPTTAKIRLRIPIWIASAPTIAINGVDQGIAATAGSFVELNRSWNNGDTIGLTLPMGLRLRRSMDNASKGAIFYGPVLLAGSLGTGGMPASDQAAGQVDYLNYTVAAAPTVMATSGTEVASWVQPTPQSLTFAASAGISGDSQRRSLLLQPFYDTHHTRYAVYWNLLMPPGIRSWTGAGSLTTWSTAGNWDALPAANYGLRFVAANGGVSTNDFSVGTQFDGIEFSSDAGAFTLSGNRIGLEGDVRNLSSLSQRIDLGLDLKDNLPWQFDAAGGDILLGGTIGGVGTLDKRGSHTLTLLSAATFAGSLRVGEGTLQVGNGGTIGSIVGSIPISLAPGATLVFNRSDSVSMANSISGTGTILKRGAGDLQWLTPSAATGPVVIETGAIRLGSTQMPGLAHRWSFNGSLNDSAGSATALLQTGTGSVRATLSSSGVTLPGGSRGAADYLSLGSGLLPKDGAPVTIELWATQLSVQSYGRIFDAGASTSENLFMAWSRSSLATDRVEWKDASTSTADDTVAPYATGTEYHIVLMVQPGAGSGGSTRVTWFAAPSSASSLGAAKGSFDTTNTLSALTDSNFWLGRSEYSNDPTSNASYNEVRIWNRSFSATELDSLHALGPDSIAVTGSFASMTDLSVSANAEFDAGAYTQQVASLSGSANAIVRMNGGRLIVGSGGNSAATFAGAFAGTGTVINNGTLRLVGNAAIPAGVSLVNNGVLDLMTWQGSLPAGFVNNGTVLERSLVAISSLSTQGTDVILTIHGYQGHSYQLQTRQSLASGDWANLGLPVPGADAPIAFTHPGGNAGASGFYRVVVSP